MAEINLWLDDYNDIYSDFDSRHYLKRRVSEDFINELRLSAEDITGTDIRLILSLPSSKRKEETEKTIISSLKNHFKSHFAYHQGIYKRKVTNGILLLVAGVIIMMINAYLTFYSKHTLSFVTVKVVLDPGGWFLLWTGLELLFRGMRDLKEERDFFRKLTSAHIHFTTN